MRGLYRRTWSKDARNYYRTDGGQATSRERGSSSYLGELRERDGDLLDGGVGFRGEERVLVFCDRPGVRPAVGRPKGAFWAGFGAGLLSLSATGRDSIRGPRQANSVTSSRS